MAPTLRDFDHEMEFAIDTDVSNYDWAVVLYHHNNKKERHMLAYFLKEHWPVECNYAAYDKAPIAIISTHEQWRLECKGARYPLQLLTDHKNIENFMTMKLLNQRQA